jgi:hypothetical protein
MPDPRCELCGDATPARLLRCDPERGWSEGLCPSCWGLNLPPGVQDADARRAGPEGAPPPGPVPPADMSDTAYSQHWCVWRDASVRVWVAPEA